jgi:hypothetical protein
MTSALRSGVRKSGRPSLLWVLGLMVFGAASAWGQMQCLVFSPNDLLRAEGYTEVAGDILLQCTGGTPTAAGEPVPQADIAVSFSLPVTNKVLAGNTSTDALLLVNEPNTNHRPSTNGLALPQTPLLNCGHAGAPDYGPFGVGVCSIAGTGNSATVYDGTTNTFGPGNYCDWQAGRPYSDAYGCGRPNAFQGQLTPGNPQTITFPQVPMDPPGPGNYHLFRIINVRVDAAAGAACPRYDPNQPTICNGSGVIIATVSASGKLRQDLFRLADRALEGEPLSFVHKGVVFRLVPDAKPSKLAKLTRQTVAVTDNGETAADTLLPEMQHEWEQDWAEL